MCLWGTISPMILSFLLSIIIVLPLHASTGSRPLFSEQERLEVARLKTHRHTIMNQIRDLQTRDSAFFKVLLDNTAKEDFALMRKELPTVLKKMEQADDAAWLEKKLRELSTRPKP